MASSFGCPKNRPDRRSMMPVSLDDYLQEDATGLAHLVRTGQASPDHLLDLALQRLDQVSGELTAVNSLYIERARRKIRDLPQEAPFRGVPFLIKDLFTELSGTICANGSAFAETAPALSSATVAERYEDAGFVIFGRTHSCEFGGTSTSESRLHGVTLNPFDLSRTAGGSSGGAAAAVASGIVPVAQATDAGGSITIPAASCGLFGLKPTSGRVSLGPTRIEGAAGMTAQHVLTRSVRDSAALLDIECGNDPCDLPVPEGGFLGDLQNAPKRLRIALVRRSAHGLEAQSDCRAALEETAALCESLGHEVIPASLPLSAEVYGRHETALRLASIAMTLEGLARRIGRAPTEADLEPATWQRYQASLAVSGAAVLEAREAMLASRGAMRHFLCDFDVILTPAMADLAPLPGTVSLERTDAEAAEINRRYTSFAGLYNWTGQTSMTVPIGQTDQGLPVGALFAARHGEEATLLRLAAELEGTPSWRLPDPAAIRLNKTARDPSGKD